MLTIILTAVFAFIPLAGCYSRQAPKVKVPPTRSQQPAPTPEDDSKPFKKSTPKDSPEVIPAEKESLVDFGKIDEPIDAKEPDPGNSPPEKKEEKKPEPKPELSPVTGKVTVSSSWDPESGAFILGLYKDKDATEKLKLKRPPTISYQLVAGSQDQEVSLALSVSYENPDNPKAVNTFNTNLPWNEFTGELELNSAQGPSSAESKNEK